MPNSIHHADRAINLAERIAAGKVKLSTIRNMNPDTALMVLIWFRHQLPDWSTILDFETQEILFERVLAGKVTKSDKTRQ